MRKKSGIETLFSGLLIGGAIGALAGLLFAPQSGEKTRKKLRTEADRLTKEGKKQLKSVIESDTVKQSKQKITDLKSRVETEVKTGVNEARQKISEKVNEAKSKVKSKTKQS